MQVCEKVLSAHTILDTQLTLWVSYICIYNCDTKETKYRTINDAGFGLVAYSQGKLYDARGV